MVIVRKPRLSAACEKKALGSSFLRKESTYDHYPACQEYYRAKQHLGISTVVQEEEGAGLTLSILQECERRSSGVCMCMCACV